MRLRLTVKLIALRPRRERAARKSTRRMDLVTKDLGLDRGVLRVDALHVLRRGGEDADAGDIRTVRHRADDRQQACITQREVALPVLWMILASAGSRSGPAGE